MAGEGTDREYGDLDAFLNAWQVSCFRGFEYKYVQEWGSHLLSEMVHNVVQPERAGDLNSKYALAMAIFHVDAMTPRSTLETNYQRLRALLASFRNTLRQPEVDLLPPAETEWKTVMHVQAGLYKVNDSNYQAVVTAVEKLYNLAEAMSVLTQLSTSPFLDPTTPNEAESEGHSDRDAVHFVKFVRNLLHRKRLRKSNTHLMTEVFNDLGVAVNCYEPLCTFKEFVPRFLQQHLYPEMYELWISNARLSHLAVEMLSLHTLVELPKWEPNPFEFSTRTGVYNVKTDSFRSYGSLACAPQRIAELGMEREGTAAWRSRMQAARDRIELYESAHREADELASMLPLDAVNAFTKSMRETGWGNEYDATIAAMTEDDDDDETVAAENVFKCVYIDTRPSIMYYPIDFSPAIPHLAWDKIAAPEFWSLLSMQGYTPDNIATLYVCALIGRLFWYSDDGWQIMVNVCGAPKTGKGMLADLIKGMLPPELVVNLDDDMEGFHTSKWIDARLIICPEMSSGFLRRFGRSRFLSLCSGEDFDVKQKGVEATTKRDYGPPVFAMSNVEPFDGDIAMLRRKMGVPFNCPIPEGKVDPNKRNKLRLERPAVMAICTKAYHIVRDEVNSSGGDIWNVVPDNPFGIARRKFEKSVNQFITFVTQSGEIDLWRDAVKTGPNAEPRDKYYAPWDTLKLRCVNWFKANGKRMYCDLTDMDVMTPVLKMCGIRITGRESRFDLVENVTRTTLWALDVQICT